MGRSKERGKPVSELTPQELASELVRCRSLLQALPDTVASKLLRKRLQDIEKRLAKESEE